ncbi:MAG: hydrogenase maturation protease [Candidatus Omnitrophica bacterium]|jgi:hydrogenase 3 maturation protease|nr:hydrogenase maturation protease [Candidatus Omnitrophota bacterium]
MERSSEAENPALEHLKLHLTGKVLLLGIGNNLRSDDGIGSLLAVRLQGKLPYIVYDASSSPENYLGKIIKDEPDTILLIDAVDFGGEAGEIRLLEGEDIQTVNFFSTHDASISLAISYLKNSLKHTGIFILAIQPKILAFGDKLSPEITQALEKIERWFLNG